MSKYADEGTIAHALAAMCLTEGADAAAYVGRLIESHDYEHAGLSPSGAKKWMTCPGSHRLEQEAAGEFVDRSFSLEVTDDMAEAVQVYVDMVRDRVEARKLAGAVSVDLRVEQTLSIEHLTGEEGATGTGDVVMVSVWPEGDAMLDFVDLKFGMGVEVAAEGSEQLQIYTSAALQELDLLYSITRCCLTIHQPRINRTPQDWEIEVGVVRQFEERCKAAAFHARQVAEHEDAGAVIHHLHPGDHCSTGFCKARATCPALAKFVQDSVGADFDVIDKDTPARLHVDLEQADEAEGAEVFLSLKMSAVDLIEDWCKAVRAETERRLLAGQPVPGYKLVQGKRGSRAWSNVEEVEATFKSMRLKQEEMYDFKLISPTSAEKLLKESPKRWNRVTQYITQSEGKPHVAPESDKRPALTIAPVADDFESLED